MPKLGLKVILKSCPGLRNLHKASTSDLKILDISNKNNVGRDPEDIVVCDGLSCGVIKHQEYGRVTSS